MSSAVQIRGFVKKLLANAARFVDDTGGSVDQALRLDPWGGMWLGDGAADDLPYEEEGAYFRARSATVGTGLTWVAAQTAFSDTTPNFYFYNADPVKTVSLRYMKLIATAVATATTAIRYLFVLDNLNRSITTDNTQNLTQETTFGPLPKGFLAKGQNSATASVIVARSANAIIAGQGLIGGLNISQDEMIVVCGKHDVGQFTGVADAAGEPSRKGSSMHPVVIPPGWSLTGHIWLPTSSASFNPEVEFGFRAR